ncbi:hypothetical protein [Actinomadura chibensis]|nr:hypothetical protein [Actinomadura chibensis]
MTGKACCPSCGTAARVSYGGRRGGSGRSRDVWRCSQHGEFTTPAR